VVKGEKDTRRKRNEGSVRQEEGRKKRSVVILPGYIYKVLRGLKEQKFPSKSRPGVSKSRTDG
jgi:hypothetical protein